MEIMINQKNGLEHKKCKCSEDYWEVIVIDNDENFNDKSTIYYHCDYCGADHLILDFLTNEILYQFEV